MAGQALGLTVRVVSNKLPSLPPAIHAAAVAEVKRAAFEVQALAQARCPVRTGTLRRSITTQIAEGGLKATVGPSVEYGKWVEWGSRGRAARPFMRPAAEAVAPRFVTNMTAVLKGLP